MAELFDYTDSATVQRISPEGDLKPTCQCVGCQGIRYHGSNGQKYGWSNTPSPEEQWLLVTGDQNRDTC